MPAVITNINRIQRTLDFASKILYFGIGKESEWTDETTPDIPDVSADEITELSFISKVSGIKYVKPDEAGEIVYMASKWTEVDIGNVWTEEIVNLYLECILDYNNYPVISYRQLGMLEEPKNIAGDVCSLDKYILSELHATDRGLLHYLDNRLVTHRQTNQQEKISIILEF